MKYEEFKTKWKTDKESVMNVNLHTIGGGLKEVELPAFVNRAEMGDFLKDYIEHLILPKRKRKKIFDWELVEKEMRKILNQVGFQWKDI